MPDYDTGTPNQGLHLNRQAADYFKLDYAHMKAPNVFCSIVCSTHLR